MQTCNSVVWMLSGSSSGSAVAVAARVAPLALCEDTGGKACPLVLLCLDSVKSGSRLLTVCTWTVTAGVDSTLCNERCC